MISKFIHQQNTQQNCKTEKQNWNKQLIDKQLSPPQH